MCGNNSLQQKAHRAAIFHIVLSFISILLFMIFLLYPEIYNFSYESGCHRANISRENRTADRETSTMRDTYKFILWGPIHDLFKYKCIIFIIFGVLILIIILIDLSLNVLLLHGVSKKKNFLLVSWLLCQGIRILFVVIAISLTMSRDVFDSSENKKIANNNKSENINSSPLENNDM